MSGYVIACYVLTVASLAGYSAWVVAKYRAVTKADREAGS